MIRRLKSLVRRIADADIPDPMREHQAPPPHEAVDETATMKRANREMAMEILARKQETLETKFNGKRQSMKELLEEMAADSDLSDCPEHFDWKWCDKAGDFIKADSRKVEFK